VGVPVPKFFSNIYNRPCTVGLLLQGVPPFRAIPHAFPSVGIQNKVLLAMPYIATSCCILKASLCRDRSCFLLNPVCPATGLVGKGCRLCNPDLHGSCENIQRVFHTLYPVAAWCHAITSKGTGLHPRRLITSCSRLASAHPEHTASPFLCATMALIQRGQEAR